MSWMPSYIAVLLLGLADSSTAHDGSRTQPVISSLDGSLTHDSVAENIVRMVTSLTSVSISKIDSRSGSEHTQLASDFDQHARTKRFSEYSPYSSNPYDLGPINQCSYPQLDVCNFESGYVVPEYVARSLQQQNSLLNNLHQQLSSVLSSSCVSSWMNFLCKATIGPRCISNTTVRYQINNYDICRQVFSSCPLSSNLSSSYCQELTQTMIYPLGTLSLVNCRLIDVDGCRNTRPSPDWLAALFERRAQSTSLDNEVRALNLSDSCQEKYVRLACTLPTCNSSGRLQGYRSSTQCNDVANCIKDNEARNIFSAVNLCHSLGTLKQPSGCAGETESCKSGTASTTYYVGISIAWSVLALIRNCLPLY